MADGDHWPGELLEHARDVRRIGREPAQREAGAVTATPLACNRSITPFQLEPSANAPWTSTTEGWPGISVT
jgi:hypothetical protein